MIVLDANVAIKLVCNEPGKAEVLARLCDEPTLVAPDWIMIEAANALRRKSLSGEIESGFADALLSAIPDFLASMHPAAPLVGQAMALSFDLDHWIYDCIYLACALDLDVPLLTSDRKFWNAAKRAGYEDVVELLTWEGQSG